MTYQILSSDGVKTYTCSNYLDGRWTCNCPHWLFRLKGKSSCKHIDEAKLHEAQLEHIFINVDWTEPIVNFNMLKVS